MVVGAGVEVMTSEEGMVLREETPLRGRAMVGISVRRGRGRTWREGISGVASGVSPPSSRCTSPGRPGSSSSSGESERLWLRLWLRGRSSTATSLERKVSSLREALLARGTGSPRTDASERGRERDCEFGVLLMLRVLLREEKVCVAVLSEPMRIVPPLRNEVSDGVRSVPSGLGRLEVRTNPRCGRSSRLGVREIGRGGNMGDECAVRASELRDSGRSLDPFRPNPVNTVTSRETGVGVGGCSLLHPFDETDETVDADPGTLIVDWSSFLRADA